MCAYARQVKSLDKPSHAVLFGFKTFDIAKRHWRHQIYDTCNYAIKKPVNCSKYAFLKKGGYFGKLFSTFILSHLISCVFMHSSEPFSEKLNIHENRRKHIQFIGCVQTLHRVHSCIACAGFPQLYQIQGSCSCYFVVCRYSVLMCLSDVLSEDVNVPVLMRWVGSDLPVWHTTFQWQGWVSPPLMAPLSRDSVQVFCQKTTRGCRPTPSSSWLSAKPAEQTGVKKQTKTKLGEWIFGWILFCSFNCQLKELASTVCRSLTVTNKSIWLK